MAEFKFYVDASFDKTRSIGVLGYIVVVDGYINEEISLLKFEREDNNIRLELRASIEVLNKIIEIKNSQNTTSNLESQQNNHFVIYTDCQSVSKLLARRETLLAKNFKSKSTAKQLNNADLYKEFFYLYELALPEIVWIKGHSSKSLRSKDAEFFHQIDKSVRHKLRGILKNI